MNSISTISMLIMSLIIGYLFAYPMYGEIAVLRDEKSARQDSLDTIIHIEQRKTELAAEFAALSDKNKQDVDTILPDIFDHVRLTSHIDAVAKKYGISIKQVSSKDLQPANSQTVPDSAGQKGFHSGTISFSFAATYDSFQSFLSELEKSLRILDIRTLNIQPGNTNMYEYRIEFETYWL
jgi:hypothetical protein